MHFLERKDHFKSADVPVHQQMIQAFRIIRKNVKVKIANGQEMAQSERNSHSKNRGGLKLVLQDSNLTLSFCSEKHLISCSVLVVNF